MKTIKFSKCPIKPHMGESWPKLAKVDKSKPVVLEYVESVSHWPETELYIDFIRKDTFSDFTIMDWHRLMERFYGFHPTVLILYFMQGDYLFTTARAYEWRKHKYYLDSIGKEFMVVET